MFAAWSATTSIHPVTSTPLAVAEIPLRAPATKFPPVTCLNFIKPVVGIALPAAVANDVNPAHTPSMYPLTPPCVMVVPMAGTFPLPSVYANHRTSLASINTSPSLIVMLPIEPVPVVVGAFACTLVSVFIVSTAPLFIVHVSPAVLAVPSSSTVFTAMIAILVELYVKISIFYQFCCNYSLFAFWYQHMCF